MTTDGKLEEFIERFLDTKAELDQELRALLSASLGRVWRRTYGDISCDTARVHIMLDDERTNHVRDWLKSVVTSRPKWLSRVDERGVPKKFSKFHTIQDVVAEADRATARAARSFSKRALAEGHEKTEYVFSDGWTIVRMLTPEALDRESAFMQHCVGNDVYDGSIHDGSDGSVDGLFSLRDPANKPHATLEVRGRSLEQLQGKQNAIPLPRYVERVVEYMRVAKIGVNSHRLGIISDRTGEIYSFDDLPDELEVSGRFHIVGSETRPIRLPLKIKAYAVSLTGHRFDRSPEVIDVEESVRIGDDCLDDMPLFPGEGSVEIIRSNAEGLPLGFKSNGGLLLASMPNLLELPVDMTVGGNLVLSHTPSLVGLPPRLRVEGKLDLSDSDASFTSIPNDARFKAADISNTPVTSFNTDCFLPSCGEDMANRVLIANSSSLEEIVGDPTFSILDLSQSAIGDLPETTRVSLSLDITSTKIGVISSAVVPTAVFDARNCVISSLPSVLDCESVNLDGSTVTFPERFICVGDLSLCETVALTSPSYLKAGTITMARCNIPELPMTTIATQLDLRGAKPTRLHAGVRTDQVMLSAGPMVIDEGFKAVEGIHLEARKEGMTHTEKLDSETAKERSFAEGGLFVNFEKTPGFFLIFDEFHRTDSATIHNLLSRRHQRLSTSREKPSRTLFSYARKFGR